MRKMLGAMALAAALGGCAPGMMRMSVAPPGCVAAPLGFSHARVGVNTHVQRVLSVRSRYDAGYRFQQDNPARWTQAASGECR